MKKICLVSFTIISLILNSCNSNTGSSSKPADSSSTKGSGSVDSAANNGIVPPSAAPGNASNSSLADTAYHAKDSSKAK